MNFEEYNQYTKKDIVKDVLLTILLVIVFFVYWIAMLLLFSLILINVWKVRLVQLVIYSGILTVVCAAAYITHLVKKRRNGKY